MITDNVTYTLKDNDLGESTATISIIVSVKSEVYYVSMSKVSDANEDGGTSASFLVSISPPAKAGGVKLKWGMANPDLVGFSPGMAAGADDFEGAVSGELFFTEGEHELPVSVAVKNDIIPEPDELGAIDVTSAGETSAYTVNDVYDVFKIKDDEWHWVTDSIQKDRDIAERWVVDGDLWDDKFSGRLAVTAFPKNTSQTVMVDVALSSVYTARSSLTTRLDQASYSARYEYQLDPVSGEISMVNRSGDGITQHRMATVNFAESTRTIDEDGDEHSVTSEFNLQTAFAGTLTTSVDLNGNLIFVGANVVFTQEHDFGETEAMDATTRLVALRGN